MATETYVPEGIEVGQKHVSQVASVDGRLYGQADNTLVAVLPYPSPQVQLTFLSIRVRYKTQTVLIRSMTPEGVIEGEAPQYQGEAEATDIGSVRMRPEDALGLAVALINNVRGVLPDDQIIRALADAGLTPK